MGRRTQFTEYQPRTILNKGKRADHWFWTRYSAYPYIGCQHGCHFCYCREEKYAPYDDPEEFAHHIKIKKNAPDLLRRALSRVPVDVVFTGDYQPVERIYRLSRKMLEVCLELGFPVFILERSPLVLRDLDLLQEIHKKSALVVAFSIISAPGSPDYERVRAMENLAPSAAKRFEVMRILSDAGITTGACLMPLLPGLCDSDENLENIIHLTTENGGQFAIPSGLTLSDKQRTYFLNLLQARFPDLVEPYRRLYPEHYYAGDWNRWLQVAKRVREYCQAWGIRDRIPRPVIPGEKRAFNKRLVEVMADRCYSLELSGAPQNQVWAWRKAAWAVEDLEQDIRLVYSSMGWQSIQKIQGISQDLIKEVVHMITEQDG